MCNGSACEAGRVGGKYAFCDILQNHVCQINGVLYNGQTKCHPKRKADDKKFKKDGKNGLEKSLLLGEEEKVDLSQRADDHL